jgi:chaperonin cofactor prefoldin
VARGDARPGPGLPADPVAAFRPEPAVVAAKPSGVPMPTLVPEEGSTGPAPATGVPAKITEPSLPKPPVPAEDRTKAVEALAKKLQETQDRAGDLERKNAALQGQVTTLMQAIAQGRADCDRRAADLQRTIDTLKPEARRLADRLQELQVKYDALLKTRTPSDPIKPKVGFGSPPIEVKPPMDVKPPVEQKKKP